MTYINTWRFFIVNKSYSGEIHGFLCNILKIMYYICVRKRRIISEMPFLG